MVSHHLGPLGCEPGLKSCNRSLVFLHQLLQLVLELGDLVTCVSLEHADLLKQTFDLILKALDVGFQLRLLSSCISRRLFQL